MWQKLRHALFLMLASLMGPEAAEAVSLIVGIPSADNTPKGEVILTHESQLSPWSDKDDWNSFNFVTYGVTDRTELSVALSNLALPKTDNASLAAGFKTFKPLLEKRFPHHEIRLTAGAMSPVSLHGDGVGAWGFSHLSIRHPRLKTRLTAGVSAGTRQLFGQDNVSAIAGIEQPVGKKITLLADWYSGSHGFAALIPAVQYHINKSDLVIVGVKIPNDNPRGDNLAVVIEIVKRLR